MRVCEIAKKDLVSCWNCEHFKVSGELRMVGCDIKKDLRKLYHVACKNPYLKRAECCMNFSPMYDDKKMEKVEMTFSENEIKEILKAEKVEELCLIS